MTKQDVERLLEYVDNRYPEAFAPVAQRVRKVRSCVKSNDIDTVINFENSGFITSCGAVIKVYSSDDDYISMGIHQLKLGDYRVRASVNGYDYECFFDRSTHEFFRGEIKENGHTRLSCGANDGVDGNDWYIQKWDRYGNQEIDVDGLTKIRFWNTKINL